MWCRIKREDILQSAEAAREGVQRRVREQELTVEQRLDVLEVELQVAAPLLQTGFPLSLIVCSDQVMKQICVHAGIQHGRRPAAAHPGHRQAGRRGAV